LPALYSVETADLLSNEHRAHLESDRFAVHLSLGRRVGEPVDSGLRRNHTPVTRLSVGHRSCRRAI
jgi:hypothetical protein